MPSNRQARSFNEWWPMQRFISSAMAGLLSASDGTGILKRGAPQDASPVAGGCSPGPGTTRPVAPTGLASGPHVPMQLLSKCSAASARRHNRRDNRARNIAARLLLVALRTALLDGSHHGPSSKV